MKELILLGTGNAMVTKCFNTCFAIRQDDEYFLVDAGGGNGGSGYGAVQTGDAAAPAGLLAVLVISGGVVTVLARRKRMR